MDQTSVKATTTATFPEFGRQRLEPGSYNLDLSPIASLPVSIDGQPSTFIEALRRLLGAKARIDEASSIGSLHSDEFVTETTSMTVTVAGEAGYCWLLSVMKKLVTLAHSGADIDCATWFYYGHDWSRDADELFSFFVTDGKCIISEHESFLHCEPRILSKVLPEKEPVWHSGPYVDEAWEIYWYRKFYSETRTGQLLVLRPDEPILYHYDRPNDRDIGREVQLVTIIKMYRLLWVAMPLLAAIAFPSIGPYMAIIACILAFDVLWRWWATRKIGQ